LCEGHTGVVNLSPGGLAIGLFVDL
jgi:hypothetical protein